MPEYRYPNSSSYRMLQGSWPYSGRTNTLRKGYLFRVRQNPGSSLPEIDASYTKVFQYNPSELGFALAAVAMDPPDAEADGGAVDPSKFQLGQASTGLELFFSRDQEVYRGTNANGANEDFRELGTQRDLADVYEILLGSDDALKLTGRAMRDISGTLYDFSASGKGIAMSPVGVAFNDYLVVYGWVQSMSWSFPKFNNRLVPTMLKINMTLDIMNISSAQQVLSTLEVTPNTLLNTGPNLNNNNSTSGSGGPLPPNVTRATPSTLTNPSGRLIGGI